MSISKEDADAFFRVYGAIEEFAAKRAEVYQKNTTKFDVKYRWTIGEIDVIAQTVEIEIFHEEGCRGEYWNETDEALEISLKELQTFEAFTQKSREKKIKELQEIERKAREARKAELERYKKKEEEKELKMLEILQAKYKDKLNG